METATRVNFKISAGTGMEPTFIQTSQNIEDTGKTMKKMDQVHVE
jgi:hypothetical protein